MRALSRLGGALSGLEGVLLHLGGALSGLRGILPNLKLAFSSGVNYAKLSAISEEPLTLCKRERGMSRVRPSPPVCATDHTHLTLTRSAVLKYNRVFLANIMKIFCSRAAGWPSFSSSGPTPDLPVPACPAAPAQCPVSGPRVSRPAG